MRKKSRPSIDELAAHYAVGRGFDEALAWAKEALGRGDTLDSVVEGAGISPRRLRELLGPTVIDGAERKAAS